MSVDLSGRVALVTGASRGIGYALCKRLAAAGAHVVAAARTTGGLEELDDEIADAGGQATLVPMDLRKVEHIENLGPALAKRFGKLDILVGNAGILGSLMPIQQLETKTWDQLMAVNVTANWHLIRVLDPLLQQSDAGRVVFLTSSVGHAPRAFWGGYATSKAALEMLAKCYARDVAHSSVKVNLFNPGGTRTAMRAQAMPGEDAAALPSPDDVAAKMLPLVSPGFGDTGTLVSYRDLVSA